MIPQPSLIAVLVFGLFVSGVLGLSFYMGSKARSAQGFFAAGGQIHWFVNGIAFAGDYLSAASFLGICGMIAFYGYDGFLYSIGYLAGWVVALFVIAEPLKRMGRFTFADALDNRFNSRGIKTAAGLSALVVSLFYLIPQMVGAGALVKPLLGLTHSQGVLIVGVVVILIVITAGMVSTTYVQFIKGSMLVIFCAVLTGMILYRGLGVGPLTAHGAQARPYRALPESMVLGSMGHTILPEQGGWKGKPYVRIKNEMTQEISVWRVVDKLFLANPGPRIYYECQTVTTSKDGKHLIVNGKPQGLGVGEADFFPVGNISQLPGGQTRTGPLGPLDYLSTIQGSEIVLWPSEKIADDNGGVTTVYYQKLTPGSAILTPGSSPTFKGVRSEKFWDKLDFISLMLGLFCGTASLPHILIRYYTVKDQASARKSTVVGIASIGFFYVLTLFLGLGAMTSGTLDITNSNMAAPLLAKSFGNLPFAVVSAIAFTTVLGTVSGLILAASGAVAHDLMANVLMIKMDDRQKVRTAKIAAVFVGIVAMVLGIVFEKFNVTFLVGWAFNVAASANLPSLIMLLFWKRTTKQGITVAVIVGMLSSLTWILLSAQAYKDIYSWDPAKAIVPFSQPALVTIPLGFIVLIAVSLVTQSTGTAEAIAAKPLATAAA